MAERTQINMRIDEEQKAKWQAEADRDPRAEDLTAWIKNACEEAMLKAKLERSNTRKLKKK